MTQEVLKLNRVFKVNPMLGKPCLLWSELDGQLLSPIWAKAMRVQELPRPPLLDFNQPKVIKDLVWVIDGVANVMTEDDLWSEPVIVTTPARLYTQDVTLVPAYAC